MVFDYLLGEWKLKDTKTVEKVVEIRGGGGSSASGLAIVQADAPAGVQGQLWLDTDDNTLYVFVNGSWIAISGGGGVVVDGVLLNENGDYFILENDDYLATE